MFIGLSLGKSIATILVCRALLGLFGCIGTILVGGTFGDIYTPTHRAIPMASFSFVVIFGTVAAPIYAGFIDQALGWRWVQGIQGLANIPLVIVIAIFRSEQEGRPRIPFVRAMCGAVWLPVGLFIYSFTHYKDLFWFGPIVGLALVGIGIFFIFESCYSYTSDCYGENSSSAIAGQGFMRNTLGTVSPLFASQFFNNLGSQYAGILLALIATLLTFIPFVLYRFGPDLWARSKLASTTVNGVSL